MHFDELTAAEQRVLGCLIEKRWTTPDQYPLSLNALRLACNQATNREPVTDFSEDEVYEAAQRLTRYGLVRLASGHTSRAIKFRHLAEEGLGLDREQLAVLCVLLLRGPQTPGELKARSERMARLESLNEVERVLGELGERRYASRLERRPGQKEDRYRQLLGGEEGAVPVGAGAREVDGGAREVDGGAREVDGGSGSETSRQLDGGEPEWADRDQAVASGSASLEPRVASLEAEVDRLRAQLDELLG